MLNMTFAKGIFSYQHSRNAQWEHLFSMDFDDILTIYLIFYSKSPLDGIKEHFIPATTFDKGM